MKKIQLIFLTTILLFAIKTTAQISVNISLGSRTTYNPPVHYYYDDNVDYYFLPEIQAYFDNREGLYIYYSSNRWIRSARLPQKCGNYNVNNGVRIAVNCSNNNPYDDFYSHKRRYCKTVYVNNHDDDDNHYHKKHKNKHHKNKHRDHDDD